MERVYYQTAAAYSDSVTSSTDDDGHQPMTDVESSSLRTLRWTDGVVETLSCVSVGGYPAPIVAIQLDSVDITDQFALSYSATLLGTRGLRLIDYVTERYAFAPVL